MVASIVLLNQLHVVDSMTFFDKSKSYAIYDSWDISKEGKLELSFKTQSSYCMLLYLDSNLIGESSSTAKYESFLHVVLTQGSIIVTQQIESEKHKLEIQLGENLNDLEWHKLTITKYIGTLQVEVDRFMKIVNFPNDIGVKFKINSRMFVGGLSKGKQNLALGTVQYIPRYDCLFLFLIIYYQVFF